MQSLKSIISAFIFICVACSGYAQEFPIAVGNGNAFGTGGAFDGTNFLFGIQGDAQNMYNVTAQLISAAGNPVGSRISLGSTGSFQSIAFDGSNYLMTWSDVFPRFAGGDTNGTSDIHGQFISTTGNLVGSSFTIVTAANIRFGQGRGGIIFKDTTYLLIYEKGGNHIDYLYGQRIRRSGNLLGAPFQISADYARECAVAFDGTNYLVAWCKISYPGVDKEIYGQLVSTSGTLVGSNFLINDGPYKSDAPVSMIFDGSRYWVGFFQQAADTTGRWNLYARFVSTSGAVTERFSICDSSKSPQVPLAAFDGRNYLITWMEMIGSVRVRGSFFSTSGVPIGQAFTVFDTLGGKFPLGGVGGFLNGHYILTATRIDAHLANGDVYGKFLDASLTGIAKDAGSLAPQTCTLFQNYPNPFNPTTTIKYALPRSSHASLKVFNPMGQEVVTLVNDTEEAGYHEVKFDGNNLASGVYFYRIQAGSFVQTRKLLLLR